jgi:hypothetical protein
MNRVKKTASILLLVTQTLWAATRQDIASKPSLGNQQSKSEQKGQPSDPKKRILSVLDQQLEAQKRFADENLRIAVQTTIADMLWGFDEPRARRLVEEVFQAIANVKTDERGRSLGPSYNVMGESRKRNRLDQQNDIQKACGVAVVVEFSVRQHIFATRKL